MTLFKSPNTIFGRHYYSFYISEETDHRIASLKPGRVIHSYNPSTCEVALGGSGVTDHPQLHREHGASLGHRRAYLRTKPKAGCGGSWPIPALGGTVECIFAFETSLISILSSSQGYTVRPYKTTKSPNGSPRLTILLKFPVVK